MKERRAGMGKQNDGLDAIAPIALTDTRRTTSEIQRTLREHILSGVLTPGTILSQVQVAKRLNVSRTPVREALRMLQAEGLVSGEANKRCKVIGFTPTLVDGIYAERIVIEALAGAITARRVSDDDIAELNGLLGEMGSAAAHADFEVWRRPHAKFHEFFARHATDPIRETAAVKLFQAQRFRALLQARFMHGWWRRGEIEHGRIAEAFARRDPDSVAAAIAGHLSRSALELLSEFAPRYEPVCIRSALMLIDAGDSRDVAA